MMTARAVRELLRRVECAQASLDLVRPAMGQPTVPGTRPQLNDAREHLEHVRLTLVGAIASSEQLAGRKVEDVR